MAKAKFPKEELQSCVWDESAVLRLEESHITGMSRWASIHSLIFKDLSSGKFYKTTYRNAATEGQDERPFEYEPKEVECQEVHKVQKLRDVWEDVT